MFKAVEGTSTRFSFNGEEFSGFSLRQVEIEGVWYETDMVEEYSSMSECTEYSFGIVVMIAGIRHSVALDSAVYEKITDWK